MKKEINVLFIEDAEEDRVNFKRNVLKLNQSSTLLKINYQEANSLDSSLKILIKEKFDLVLLDLSLPDSEGMDGVEKIRDYSHSHMPIIILTGQESETMALKAIQLGAQDYLLKKEISPYTLSRSIMYAIERSNTSYELEILRVAQAKSLKMATLGETAGNIAHEINNPLTIILGYAERIKRVIQKTEGNEKLIDYSEKIISVTHRVAKIVKSLKAYSRKEDDDPMACVKLTEILEDTLSLCSEKFKAASIDLILDDIQDIEFECKDVQISQVLLNLLSNSYDAIKDHNTKWVKLESNVKDDNLIIKIIDSGNLNDEITKKKIFDPFYTTKSKGDGTGLGMSISKNIIDLHHGSLKLMDSVENTTFKITLPIKAEK